MAVIDASVYLALVNAHEPAHAQSWRWLQQAQQDGERIVAPVILLAEVGAAVSRGQNDPTLAHQVRQQLAQSSLIQLEEVSRDLAIRSAEIAIDYRIRGCDAVYVALAEQLSDYLITLDQQQLSRGQAVVATRQP